ncbi:MAG: YtxH domain-containing protein [Gemmatimonadetes bacterium]|nr:YtxH domain-containing protein [Gemmatimonadota bacterium]
MSNREYDEKRGPNAPMTFLIGALVGGAAAVLMAPDRGENTRKRLKEGARHIYKAGEEAVLDARDTVSDKAETLSDATRDRMEEAAETAGTQVNAMKTAVRRGKEAFEEELEKKSA